MEIQVKVIQVMLPEAGKSQTTGKSWTKQEFVGETIGNYPNKIKFQIFGDQKIKDNPIKEGEIYNVSFDLESREWNGRWYTDVDAWKVVPAGKLVSAESQEEPKEEPVQEYDAQPADENEDLPF